MSHSYKKSVELPVVILLGAIKGHCGNFILGSIDVDNGEEVNRFDTYVAVSLGFDWTILEAGWLIAVK